MVPLGGTELLGRLLVLGEHVLAAHSQHVVHRIPELRETVELGVVKLNRECGTGDKKGSANYLNWRRSDPGVWTIL